MRFPILARLLLALAAGPAAAQQAHGPFDTAAGVAGVPGASGLATKTDITTTFAAPPALGSTTPGPVSASDLTVSGASATDMAGAWTQVTGAVVSGTGTLGGATATIRYKKLGLSVYINVVIAVSAAGTGASNLIVTLPFAAGGASYGVLTGVETLVTGKMVAGTIGSGGTSLVVKNYDNTYPGVTGASIGLSGIYEAGS